MRAGIETTVINININISINAIGNEWTFFGYTLDDAVVSVMNDNSIDYPKYDDVINILLTKAQRSAVVYYL